ncbi:peroxiredoxin [Asanoa ishikariensis]|uniref:Alkyl hydroperoxide reductase E n=2 Tax=Asanoa ishikariensis TaxID=137265 RepID=A0A1H3NW36_9ACTN|nr:peroxiredoxin [Asanoa ishikariensis]SDY92913.1 peroxiredoxin (alkyl hydroperoxide reductase subunit C) [Asanoa ishikariensis]
MLQVGTPAPDFTLKDQNNQEVRLSSYLGSHPVLLVFYPLAFSGTCSGEMAALEKALPSFAAAGVSVLTISVDSSYSHKIWLERESWSMRMLADFWPHGGVARSYGVFNESAGFADRGTFLIDRAGSIRWAECLGPGSSRDTAVWLAAVASLDDG